jgi:hypothetical protein
VSITGRWVVAAVIVLLVVGLLVWARGDEHHHGDEVGAVGVVSTVTMR